MPKPTRRSYSVADIVINAKIDQDLEKQQWLQTNGVECPECMHNALWFLTEEEEAEHLYAECQWCGQEFWMNPGHGDLHVL